MCTYVVPCSRKFSKSLIFENFQTSQENIFFKINDISCTCTSGMFRSSLRKMRLLKYFKHIEPSSKEERTQSVLPKPDGSLACLIPCSIIETAKSAVHEIFTNARALLMKTVPLLAIR